MGTRSLKEFSGSRNQPTVCKQVCNTCNDTCGVGIHSRQGSVIVWAKERERRGGGWAREGEKTHRASSAAGPSSTTGRAFIQAS